MHRTELVTDGIHWRVTGIHTLDGHGAGFLSYTNSMAYVPDAGAIDNERPSTVAAKKAIDEFDLEGIELVSAELAYTRNKLG